MEELPSLAEFLADCEEIYLSGCNETLEEVTLFVSNVKSLVRLKNKNSNDSYFSERLHRDEKHH